jgi:ribosome modulation factor
LIDLTKIPIYDPDPAATERRIWNLASEEGYAAYKAGVSIDKCPPFKNNDLAVSWKMGWRWAHEVHFKRNQTKAKTRCHKDCEH